jgi:hypothetical protein
LELCNGTITATNPWLPKPQIKNDVSLMSTVVEANLSTSQQQKINAYHIFLRAISHSDIATFHGKRVNQAAYDELREPIETKLR